jgi:hypothetical protein
MEPITYPLKAFAREQKISPDALYRLINTGQLKSVMIGARRHIFPASYRQIIERLQAEQGSLKLPNPKLKMKAAAPAAPARKGKRRAAR